MNTLKIVFYTTNTGKQPFVAWQNSLDTKIKSIVMAKIARIRIGNFGDCKTIKGCLGMWELRIDYGAGYRIYYGKSGSKIIVLLIGGDKGTQERDIAKAKRYWLEYKESNDE